MAGYSKGKSSSEESPKKEKMEEKKYSEILAKYDDSEDSKIAEKIKNCKDESLKVMDPIYQDWDEYYRLFKQKRTNKQYPWMSNLFIPKAFKAIQTMLPRVAGGLFHGDKLISILPRRSEDVANAKLSDTLISYQLERMNIGKIVNDWVNQMLVYGTSLIKVTWRLEKETRMVKQTVQNVDKQTGNVVLKQEERPMEVVIYDGPWIEVVDNYDIYVDPKATCIENARWVVHRTEKTLTELKMLEKRKTKKQINGKTEDVYVGVYKNLDVLEAKIETGEIKEAKPNTYTQDRKEAQNNYADSTDGSEGGEYPLMEVLEYWGCEDGKQWVTTVCGGVVIRDEENPFWHKKKPFIRIVDYLDLFSFWGIGEIEPIVSLCNEVNDIRNQRMDNSSNQINNMWIVDRNANVSNRDLVSKPNGIIKTDNVNGIIPLRQPDISQSAYMEEQQLDKDINDALGLSDVMTGQDPQRYNTATTTNILTQGSLQRVQMKIDNIQNMGIKPLAEMLMSLNLQFLTEAIPVRIFGEAGRQFININQDNLVGEFDFIPIGSEMTGNNAVRQQQLLQLFNLTANFPEVQRMPMLKMIFDSFDVLEADQILVPPPPPAPVPPPPPPPIKKNINVSIQADKNPEMAEAVMNADTPSMDTSQPVYPDNKTQTVSQPNQMFGREGMPVVNPRNITNPSAQDLFRAVSNRG